MEGLSSLLNKLTIQDVEKLKVLLSLSSSKADKPDSSNTSAVTLRVFAEEYKSHIQSSKSVSYFRSVNTSMNYLLKFFSPQTLINSISLREVESFMIFLQNNVKKGYAVYYKNLKAAFNKAMDWSYVNENYFTKVKLPKRQKLAPVFISSDQLAVITKQIKFDMVRDAAAIGFYTGMRRDEIVNLKWKNVNLDAKIITVGDEEFITKGRKQRFIPICEEAMEILKRRKEGVGGGWLEVGCGEDRSHPALQSYTGQDEVKIYRLSKENNGGGYVFCKSNGERFTGDYFSRRFKRACKAAGMDKSIHFHSLRHSFASNLAQQGVSLYVIKELLGHSSVSTTEIYSHLNIETLKEAISVLDGPSNKQAQMPVSKTSGLRLIDSEKKWSEV